MILCKKIQAKKSYATEPLSIFDKKVYVEYHILNSALEILKVGNFEKIILLLFRQSRNSTEDLVDIGKKYYP